MNCELLFAREVYAQKRIDKELSLNKFVDVWNFLILLHEITQFEKVLL